MRAHVLTCRDPFNPGRRDHAVIRRRRKISHLAPRTAQPCIAYHNGRVILRREWHRRVMDGDIVSFVVLPAGGGRGGGGGKNPLQAVLSLAIMAVSGPIAGALLGEAGAVQVLGSITLKTIVGGAISLAGNALISHAFAGRPSNPSSLSVPGGSITAASPTYNIAAQGNLARLDSAIPVQYGRMMAYPDLAAQPYAEYSGNEQYLYQLLCIGQGYYDIEAIRIEDTSIANFPEITYQVIEPGAALTLFPANVVTSVEVTGQLALNGVYLGGFIANAAGTTANTIAVDMVCPRGLYWANDSGGLSPVQMSFTVEARTVDSGGSPTSGWVTLGAEIISGATATPQRYSYRYGGLSGRYEVRLQRTSAPGGTSRYADDLNWAGLRAYLPETRTWAGMTLLALRMQASNSLSNLSARKINVICTRKLPIYSAGAWSAPQPTRSPAWALADALRASYGGGLSDARIDIAKILALAATYAARGDCFDARFDQTLTLWEALQKIGQAVRTRPYMQGGIVHFARDEAASVPVALFSMRNIVHGSFSVDYLMPTEQTADCLDVAYFDSAVWSSRRVAAALGGSSSLVPLKIDLFGVVSREHAYREGLYLAAVNRYRRKSIKFTTEMEGFIPSFGDLIAISHDMPAWGTSGEITAVEAWASPTAIAGWSSLSGATAVDDVLGPDGATMSRAITDDNPAAYEVFLTYPYEVIVPGVSYTRTFFVKKDSDSTRFVGCRMRFLLVSSGTTTAEFDVELRTDTGANQFNPVGTGSAETVAWDSSWWRVTITGLAPAGSDEMRLNFYAAYGTSFPTKTVTAMGTATLWIGPITRLTLSEPVSFATGTYYISLRKRDGSIEGPYPCTAGRSAYEVVLAGLFLSPIYVGGAEERTHFSFGKGEAWRQPARVVSIKPISMTQVAIEAINEDASVHTADSGVTAPAAQYSLLPSLFTAPIVSNLTVRSSSSDSATALVSWTSAPGAIYYVIDISSDGDTWGRVGETTGNNYTVKAVYGNASLIRVAAIGRTAGPFVTVSYSTYSGYMWNSVASTLMWSGSSSTLMWS